MESQTEQIVVNSTNEEAVENSSASSVDYSEQLLIISDQLDLNNHLVGGSIFFEGVLGGILLLTVLWSRFNK